MAMKVRYTVFDGEIVSEERNGVERDYLPDALGSTIALLDNTQTQTDAFSYWPYGEEKSRTGTTPTPFQFVGTQGYYRDSANKTYVRARHLDTAKGRWITVDPLVRVAIGQDLYRYVVDAPTVLVDPTGLLPDSGSKRLPPHPAQPNCSGYKAKQGPWRPLDRNDKNCRGYMNLCQSGDVWACNAYWACTHMGWPKDRPGSKCVRGCLQFQIPFNDLPGKSCADLWCQHQFCFKACGWYPDWPLAWEDWVASCCGEFVFCPAAPDGKRRHTRGPCGPFEGDDWPIGTFGYG